MKTATTLIGSVIMASVIMCDATGHPRPTGAENACDPKAVARKLIEDALRKLGQQDEGSTSSHAYEATVDEVLSTFSGNLTVNGILKGAKTKATAVKGPTTAKVLRDALVEAQEIITFKPVVEAPLPEGFPEQTLVGEIQVKRYPKYRLARVMMPKSDDRAFWTLFIHIKSKEIAMTAPVEMTYAPTEKGEPQKSSMAFLYRNIRQGAVGKEGQIEVVNVPAIMALTGVYDKIVSIEMIEAVGHEFLDQFFRKCSNLLRPTGLMVLQTITIPDHRYDGYRRSVDFIQKYIFPGGCIPAFSAMANSIRRETDFRVFHLEEFGRHYAETLARWRAAFWKNIEQVRKLGFDERFIRMWHYYLCYCEAGFLDNQIGVAHLVLAKPDCRRGPIL